MTIRVMSDSLTAEDANDRVIVVSPLDIHAYLMDLPPIKGDLVENAIRFRLRALHPGNPTETRIDFKQNGTDSYIVYAVQDADLQRYRGLRSPLIAAPSLLLLTQSELSNENRVGIIVARDWIEAVLFNKVKFIAAGAIARTENGSNDLKELLSTIPDEAKVASPYLLDLRDTREIQADGAQISIEDGWERLTGKRAARIELNGISSRTKLGDHLLFNEKKKSRMSRRLRISALVILNMALASFAFDRYVDVREESLAKTKAEYRIRKERNAATEALRKELTEMEAALAGLPPRRLVSGYSLLAAVADCLGKGTWTRSIVVQNDSFQIEAEGPDSLRVLRRFESSRYFADIRLHQATPLPTGGERFSLSGRIRDDAQ